MGSQTTNVDTVRRFTAALGAGELDTCLELLDPDLVFAEAASLPFGGDRVGKQGFLDLLAAVSRDYRVTLDAPEVTEAGEAQVLVRVTGTISARATRRAIPLQALDLYSLRDGLITRIDVFYKDSAAVTALCVDDTISAQPALANGGASA